MNSSDRTVDHVPSALENASFGSSGPNVRHFEGEQLDVANGDVLVLRFGDPENGWVPSPEQSEKMTADCRAALDKAGLTKVAIVPLPYAVRLTVLRQREADND